MKGECIADQEKKKEEEEAKTEVEEELDLLEIVRIRSSTCTRSSTNDATTCITNLVELNSSMEEKIEVSNDEDSKENKTKTSDSVPLEAPDLEAQDTAEHVDAQVTRSVQRESIVSLPGAYVEAPGAEPQRLNDTSLAAAAASPLLIRQSTDGFSSSELSRNDNDSHDGSSTLENIPIPPPRLRREENIQSRQEIGAVHVGNHHNATEEESPAPPPVEEPSSSISLPKANLVEPSDLLPLAKSYHETTTYTSSEARERKRQKLIKTTAGVGILVLVMLGILLLALLNHAEETTDPPMILTSHPSQAPTSLQDSILQLVVPAQSQQQVMTENPASPQSQALAWLMEEDVDHLLILSEERIRQKFALATIYFATGGTTAWVNTTHWLNHSIHECDWFHNPEFARKSTLAQIYTGFMKGLLEPLPTSPCDSHGIYQHLWLDINNLVGSLPDELYQLTNLQTLSLGWNPEGTVPEELWNLSQLDTLMIHRNQKIGGTIGSGIGSLAKLRWFVMDECSLTGALPAELGQAVSLEHFFVGRNQLSWSIPSELFLLSKLVVASLYGNSFQGTLPTEIGLLTSTTYLKLSENQLSGPLPSELGLLSTKMVSLDMKHNHLLSGTIPTELGLLTNLVELDLLNNQLSGQIPEELSELTSLGLLTLANNSLSGSFPQLLSALQHSLYTLNLQGNPLLSGTIPMDLCSINGTWISSSWESSGGPEGLSFDCTGLLCGCICDCNS
ncbi:Leucine Rich Repeat [Seminavis robusta]|uniref:Leucine Rich Repeat n=1 Tax=Seminavis robusta TaxID=568900 RepID=A0A9N8E0W6_9STRA|nr:Leucine Rich Repeat [Seminavis robusta]|eukprot:Sro449_g145340.1 Leucine Rich Repeat (732) ;mRNA; r:38295-40741